MENKKTIYHYNVLISGKGSEDFDTIKEAVKYIEKEANKNDFFYLNLRKMGSTGCISFKVNRNKPLKNEN